MPRFEEDEIKSVAGLLTKLKADERRLHYQNISKPKVWFRGLKDIGRHLVPTFHRNGYSIRNEIYMMNLFKQNSFESISQMPDGEWEWMFLMRHHKLPSRLLDWTENPLVGLYFAVCPRASGPQPMEDGVLWVLLPTRLNQWALGWPEDDDSLPMFTENKSEYSLGENEAISLYLPSKIRESVAEGTPTPPPAAGICPRTNQRMRAQMSVFTIHHADNSPLEDAGDSTHIWRYRIPANKKGPMLDDLKRIGITRRILFPDLDNVSQEVIEHFGGH